MQKIRTRICLALLLLLIASAAMGEVLILPNPFDPAMGPARIAYTLNADSDVVLYIFDTSGRVILKKTYSSAAAGGSAGYNEVAWNGKDQFNNDLSNDVYLIRIIGPGFGGTPGKGKFMLIRSR